MPSMKPSELTCEMNLNLRWPPAPAAASASCFFSSSCVFCRSAHGHLTLCQRFPLHHTRRGATQELGMA